MVVKDSSANKCGVICSSYEIMASMMLDTDEFLGIKDELVADVLVKLRELAHLEAELLFREHRLDPTVEMPEVSSRISNSITRIHDAVVAALVRMEGGDRMLSEEEFASGLRSLGLPPHGAPSMRDLLDMVGDKHLPKKLREVADERLITRVPWAYVRNVVACMLSSRIVYKEGLAYVEKLPDSRLAEIALRYVMEERAIRHLVEGVLGREELTGDERARAAELLQQAGVRAALKT